MSRGKRAGVSAAWSRPWRSLVAGMLCLMLLVGPADPHAWGAEEPASGWWWRGSRAGVIVRPPVVPDGGLWVAQEISDALAVSALRGSATVTHITLRVLDVSGSVAVRACPAATTWEPVQGGLWEDRPTAWCGDGQVLGVLDDDRLMHFDVAALGSTDIALVPDAGAGPFSITFARPDAAAVSTATISPRTSEPAAPDPAVPTGSSGSTQSTVRPVEPAEAPGTFIPAPLGSGAVPFDGQVSMRPVPGGGIAAPHRMGPGATVRAGGGQVGERAPAALLLALGLVAVWIWRTRVAVAGATLHPLSDPFGATGELDAAHDLLELGARGSRP